MSADAAASAVRLPVMDPAAERAALECVSALAAREIACLDEQRWDEWLALYTEDCEFWVPAWVDESRPGADPQVELSLIYYASRAGLEDRVLRLRSGRSVASVPLRRTMHQLSNFLVLAADAREIRARCSSVCHVHDPHATSNEVFFGHTHYVLRHDAGTGRWRIAKKRILVLNDTLPSAVDVYCL